MRNNFINTELINTELMNRGGRRNRVSRKRTYDDPQDVHNERRNIAVGMEVAIVKKEDQQTGKQTIGVVAQILTNSTIHPRGIKVRLVNGTVGRIQKVLSGGLTASSILGQDRSTQHLRNSTVQSTTLQDWMSPVDDVADWKCTSCSFTNSFLLPYCELCGDVKI